MPQSNISDQDVADLVQRVTVAAKAYISGDMETYFSLIHHADDFTLMSPFGGVTVDGFDISPERLTALKDFFRSGTAEIEVVQTHASGDLVVLVIVERQRGVIGGLPAQDLSLRVTWVFRRKGTDWEQVHRHADPLVHPIRLEQLAALARGQDLGQRRDTQ
jgi:ketosteroid isomerase-like protein